MNTPLKYGLRGVLSPYYLQTPGLARKHYGARRAQNGRISRLSAPGYRAANSTSYSRGQFFPVT